MSSKCSIWRESVSKGHVNSERDSSLENAAFVFFRRRFSFRYWLIVCLFFAL